MNQRQKSNVLKAVDRLKIACARQGSGFADGAELSAFASSGQFDISRSLEESRRAEVAEAVRQVKRLLRESGTGPGMIELDPRTVVSWRDDRRASGGLKKVFSGRDLTVWQKRRQ